MRLSIIALPDQDSSDTIHALMRQACSDTRSTRALTFPPHLTLWAAFKIEHLAFEALKNALSTLSAATPAIPLHLTKYGFYPWKVIFLQAPVTDDLMRLHMAVLAIVQKYRTPWVTPALLESTHFSEEQSEFVRRYGYQFAGKFFSPHFTLAGNDMTQAAFDTVSNRLATKNPKITATITRCAIIDSDNQNAILHTFDLAPAPSPK